jgi:hypothetical protein
MEELQYQFYALVEGNRFNPAMKKLLDAVPGKMNVIMKPAEFDLWRVEMAKMGVRLASVYREEGNEMRYVPPPAREELVR